MNKREEYVYRTSEIEANLKSFFTKNSKVLIFDIGACEGLDSIRYSKMFPSAKIIAFEPLDSNIKIIKKNLQTFNINNVEYVPVALSDKIEVVDFYLSSGSPIEKESPDWIFGNKQNSLFPPNKNIMGKYHSWLKFENVQKIQTLTLEQFCKDRKIDSIDFIHMDVQGAEIKVLEGAGGFLKKINIIWLEVERVELYKNQPLKKDIEEFFRKNGFLKLKDTVTNVSGDQLYVNKKYYKENEKTFTYITQKVKSFFT